MDIFSKQELQRLDFELEDMEKYHNIDEIKRSLKVNETFKKVISRMTHQQASWILQKQNNQTTQGKQHTWMKKHDI